mmetsp:Transcript_113854/g.276483  ORF Transcript_113854/g.276483 Transcript_113854/m.276483 type:complete len:321 (+) Transcript_113854:3-965(+)
MRCGAWLGFEEALAHGACRGRWWDYALAGAAAQWAPRLERMAAHVEKGEDPYYGLLDLRQAGEAHRGGLPALWAGRRQIVRVPCEALAEPLEVVIDIPPLGYGGGDEPPLQVLIYFHGHGESSREAPPSMANCAIVAAQCPRTVGDRRCFWFQEGHGGAWERHEHDKLFRCEPMLEAAGTVAELAVKEITALRPSAGVAQDLCVLGVSMGGHAALEFARSFPGRVRSLGVIAGYYEEREVGGLLQAIEQIPLLLVHRHGDRCCPFPLIRRVYDGRLGAPPAPGGAPARTEAWFSAGDWHGPSEEERGEAIRWLLAQGRAA